MTQMSFSLGVFATSILLLHIANAVVQSIIDQSPAKIPAKKIFQPPHLTSISDIDESSTPWLDPSLEPSVHRFEYVVMKAVRSSPVFKKILLLEIDPQILRQIFFKVDYTFLDKHGHPVGAALANIVSKSVSLFDKLPQPVYFEAVAVSLAEFFLSEGVEPDRKLAELYVRCVEEELESADLSDTESTLQAYFDGYIKYFSILGYELDLIIDKAFELFASQVIILYDRSIKYGV